MKLNDTEKAIIEAYRDGADLEVKYHGETSVDEAFDKVNKFGKVTSIDDLTSESDAVSFVSIKRRVKNLEFLAFVDVRRTTDYYFQDVGK